MSDLIGKRVKVYFNLHKKLYSVVDCKTGLVIDRVNEIMLNNVKFTVSQAGRNRVLRESQKNVHAFVTGIVTTLNGVNTSSNGVTYNPYKYDSFVTRNDEKPIFEANTAMLTLDGKRPKMYAA